MTTTAKGSAETDATATQPADRMTATMWVAAAVSALSSLLYGYDTGIISGALLQIRDLVDAIRIGREPRVTGVDLVRALEVIDAAYASAALGRPVQVRSDS